MTFYDKQVLQRIFSQDAAIGSVFNLFTRAISPKLARMKEGGWAKNIAIEKEIDYELAKLQSNLEATIYNNQKWASVISQTKNDELVKNYIRGMSLTSIIKDKLFQVNKSALDAFINRRVEGLNLSDMVWNITNQTKQQLEFYLESGIATGRSAAGISQDVRQILKEPDKLFRRVRNEKGDLVPSNPMKAFKPGQGVYKSSHQNAVRLAATETNMAYRMADHTRWNDLDFVTGYEVKLSSSHPAPDICDHMKGIYPKDFVFRGWHPRCFCHAEPVLMPPDDFMEYIDADEATATSILEKHTVGEMPKSATSFIDQNKETISKYKNAPYWVHDNFIDGDIKKNITF